MSSANSVNQCTDLATKHLSLRFRNSVLGCAYTFAPCALAPSTMRVLRAVRVVILLRRPISDRRQGRPRHTILDDVRVLRAVGLRRDDVMRAMRVAVGLRRD